MKSLSPYNYIIVLWRASWAGLICRTHQHYRRQWSNSRRWLFHSRLISDELEQRIDGYGWKDFEKTNKSVCRLHILLGLWWIHLYYIVRQWTEATPVRSFTVAWGSGRWSRGWEEAIVRMWWDTCGGIFCTKCLKFNPLKGRGVSYTLPSRSNIHF